MLITFSKKPVMKYPAFILLLILLSACRRPCCSIFDLDINISVKDSAGNDLLDPSFPGSFKKDSINIIYLVNGKRANLDYLWKFNIYQDSSGYVLRIFPYDINSEYSVSYIDWNQSDEDTIKCEIERTSNITSVTKVWFDGQLKWQAGTERYFTIIK